MGIFLPRSDFMKGNAEVVAVPRDEAYAGSVAPSDNAEAVMLDFVNPSGASRRFFRKARQARLKARQGKIGAQTAPELTRY